MKKIEAIIRTSKFEDVKAQLKEIGIDFFSYWDADMKVHNIVSFYHYEYIKKESTN